MKSSTSVLLFLSSLSSFLSHNGVQGLLDGESIIGGADLDRPHEFPYLVSLENSTLDHWCGGSIIADQYILTAAHCVMKDDVHFREFPHQIVAGVDDVNSEESTRVMAEVEKIYVSERYNHTFWSVGQMALDDWALLKLASKLDVVNNPSLKIIDLPQKVDGQYSTYVSEVAVLAGYGHDFIEIYNKTADRGNSSGVLHKASVMVLENPACAYYVAHGFNVYDFQICAKFTEDSDRTKARGPCSGDSGSPLVIDNTVIGTVSVSPIGCDDRVVPSVYTRISSFVDTIKNAMNGNTAGLRVGTAPWLQS